MQFIFPTFLWALGALAIPVIIHLFHFRRFKKVYFTNVHLLKEIKEETSSKSRIKNLLILLSRLLALAMLVFAFAQPIISEDRLDNSGPKNVTLIVDNSYSMEADKDDVPLLIRAKDQAAEIVKTYGENDKFLILTHDLPSKYLRNVDQKTALSFIEEISGTPEVNSLEDILNIASRISFNTDQDNQFLYVLSDFQANISDFETPLDSTVDVSLIPIQSLQENNISIVSAEFDSPVPMNNVTNQLLVSFENNGNVDQDVQFRITYKGQTRPQGIVHVAAESTTIDTVPLAINEVGWQELELIVDDHPITFDDRLFVCFEIKSEINILNIYHGNANRYLSSAFESIDYYRLQHVNQKNIKYDLFGQQDLIILDDLTNISTGLSAELTKYVENGGNLLVFPSNNAQINDYNQLLGKLNADRLGEYQKEEKQVSEINIEEFIFNNVYETRKRNLRLPISKEQYKLIRNQSSDKDNLLRFRDGTPYLSKYVFNKGHLYLSSSPLNEDLNSLVLNAEIFIPMLYKISISSGIKKNIFNTIGKDELIEFKNLENLDAGNYLMTGTEEFIPTVINNNRQSLLDIRDQITQAGMYDLTLNDNLIAKMAFNYNRIESDVRYGDMSEIAKNIGSNAKILDNIALADISSYINEKHEGIKLWRWCLILALLFLLLETTLLRLWK